MSATTTITPQIFLRRVDDMMDMVTKNSNATFDVETPSPASSQASMLISGMEASESCHSLPTTHQDINTREDQDQNNNNTANAEFTAHHTTDYDHPFTKSSNDDANTIMKSPSIAQDGDTSSIHSYADQGIYRRMAHYNPSTSIAYTSHTTSEVSCASTVSYKSSESLQFDFDSRKPSSCHFGSFFPEENAANISFSGMLLPSRTFISSLEETDDKSAPDSEDTNSIEQQQQHSQSQQQLDHECDSSSHSSSPLNQPNCSSSNNDNNISVMRNASSELSFSQLYHQKSPPSSTMGHRILNLANANEPDETSTDNINQKQHYPMPKNQQRQEHQNLNEPQRNSKQSHHCQPKPMSRSRKVQPLVYSAIGSLEKVTKQNLGSFNSKLYLASRRNKKKPNKSNETSVLSSASTSKTILDAVQSSTRGTTSNNDTTRGRPLHDQINDYLHIDTSKSMNTSDRQDHSIYQSSFTQDAHGNDTTNHMENNQIKSTKSSNVFDPQSSLRPSLKTSNKCRKDKKKKVTIDYKNRQIRHIEVFRPSCDAYTPRMERKKIKYKPAEERASMETMSTATMGSLQKPNFRDALRRVAIIIQQHIVKIEQRFESGAAHLNLFTKAMRDAFDEENFVTPRYKYSMVNLPMGRAGVVYGMRKIRTEDKIPTADDIYEFAHKLFNKVQLSSECSIICLIYIERIMEVAKVPVMAKTWRPIFMCGLLLASKVWQDWASWNIEFASVYPQFSLNAINKLEVKFCKMVKWDLYISTSLYAKYYFALRSLLEKHDFRRKYVQMIGGMNNVAASEAMKISKRSEMVKAKALSHLSKSM